MNTEESKQDSTRIIGIFKDYILALDSVRNVLSSKEKELNKALIGFYKITEASMNESSAKEYLMTVSKSFDECNQQVGSNTPRRQLIIDGQVAMANMINLMKESAMSVQHNVISVLTDFWENLRYTLEMFQILVDTFDRDIFNRIKLMYAGSSVPNQVGTITTTNDKTIEFLKDIDKFAKQLPDKILRCRLLIRSCDNHMKTNLIDKSSVSDRLLIGINISQYPLLRIVPDLAVKFNNIFQICRKWLDREETFIYEVNQLIRQKKLLAREKETRIMSARDHQRDFLKIFRTSNLLCQNTKKKLKEISMEIKSLEAQIHETTLSHQKFQEEKLKTVSMSEFLNLSISQTRRNYALQMKKEKLLSQVRTLENTLSEIDSEIHFLKHSISSKLEERNKTHQKLLSEEKACNDAKSELESYSQSLYNYKLELIALRQSLATMESFKVLKTSPEFIENIHISKTNHVQPVQLSSSLKHSIDKKRKLISNKS